MECARPMQTRSIPIYWRSLQERRLPRLNDPAMGPNETEPGLSQEQVSRLNQLRRNLLHLHKTLLEMERQDYEKRFGRVTPGELLQLVINGSQFAWLRLLSALIVEIDEVLSAQEPSTIADFDGVVSQARRLSTSSDNEEFKTRYQAAMQQEPAVVMAHSTVMQQLRQNDQ